MVAVADRLHLSDDRRRESQGLGPTRLVVLLPLDRLGEGADEEGVGAARPEWGD